MAEVLRDLFPPAVSDAIEANLLAFFPLFARLPGAEVHIGPDLLWSVTDIAYPLFNSILGARLEPQRPAWPPIYLLSTNHVRFPPAWR